jgi:hypothetical protein
MWNRRQHIDFAIILENNYKIYLLVLNEFESMFNEKAKYVFKIQSECI